MFKLTALRNGTIAAVIAAFLLVGATAGAALAKTPSHARAQAHAARVHHSAPEAATTKAPKASTAAPSGETDTGSESSGEGSGSGEPDSGLDVQQEGDYQGEF